MMSSPGFATPSVDTAVPEDSSRALSVILMSVLALVSLIGNTLLLTTILSSAFLRCKQMHLLIVNAAFVNLLDTGANMLVSLLYVARGKWTLGDWMCGVHAATGWLVSLMTISALALLAVDRALVLLDLRLYTVRFTLGRLSLLVACTWLIAVLFVSAILIGSIPAAAYPSRYLCSVAENTHLGYSLAFICLYLLCAILILLCFGLILLRAHQERVTHQHRQLPEQTSDYTDLVMGSRQFSEQLHLGKCIVGLFVVYFVLQSPALIMTHVLLIRNSQQMVSSGWVEWQVPADAEAVITWLRIIYPDVFPFMVFAFCPDIWCKFSQLVCCRRRSGTAVDITLSQKELMACDLSAHHDMQPLDDNQAHGVLRLIATSDGIKSQQQATDRHGRQISHTNFADVTGFEPPLTSDYDSEDSGSWGEVLANRAFVGGRGDQIITPAQRRPPSLPLHSLSHVNIESAPNTAKTAKPRHNRSKSATLFKPDADNNQDRHRLQPNVANTDHNKVNRTKSRSKSESEQQKTTQAEPNKARQSSGDQTAAFRPAKRERSFVQQIDLGVKGLTEMEGSDQDLPTRHDRRRRQTTSSLTNKHKPLAQTQTAPITLPNETSE